MKPILKHQAGGPHADRLVSRMLLLISTQLPQLYRCPGSGAVGGPSWLDRLAKRFGVRLKSASMIAEIRHSAVDSAAFGSAEESYQIFDPSEG